MEVEEPQYICLNYCMSDPETGACLTCGRPPIPVTGLNLNDSLLNQMLNDPAFTLRELPQLPADPEMS